MTREELIKNLKYTMKKHEHDRVATFGTNISLMCKDMLDYLKQEPKCESCELNRQRFMQTLDVAFELGKASSEPYKGMTNGEVIKAMFPDIPRTLEWHIQNVTDDNWWNSPYNPQERSE
jgi:hypothetical protein